MEEIAPGVAVVPIVMSNAYPVGTAASWVLVDALTPGHTETIKEAAAERFGANTKPRAIVLTHGHFDHAGSAPALAELWGVRVYAHRLETPFLTGRSKYPPLDPTAPGFFSGMSRFFPSRTVDVGKHLAELNTESGLPGLEGWECHFTPGHAPGHVAFFNPQNRVLLGGDAFTTVNLDRFMDTIRKRKQVCRPPAPPTFNWEQARSSVQRLAALRPMVLAAGHGTPMSNGAEELQHLADHFPMPSHGRYVSEPARTDENGITYLPPAPFDATPKIAAAVALGAIGAVWASRKRSGRGSENG